MSLLEGESVRRIVAETRPTTIVHLAAVVPPGCYKNPGLARRVNVEGTRTLLDAASMLPAHPHVIAASSAAVYGSRNPHRHPEPVTESTPLNPVDCYGEDKCCVACPMAQPEAVGCSQLGTGTVLR
jgi:nucleoside-diphosphate-sugar epimerase